MRVRPVVWVAFAALSFAVFGLALIVLMDVAAAVGL